MAAIKFAQTQKVLSHIDADIIALQEVENAPLLERLGKALGYSYYAFTKTDTSPMGVGLLSRFKILSHQSLPTGVFSSRDLLHVKVQTPTQPLHVWVNHWPSQKKPPQMRMDVAKVLHAALLNQEEPTILLGDFNTPHHESSPLRKYFLNQGWYDPWVEMPHDKRWSHDFFGKKSALDRILVSPSLQDGKALESETRSFRVYAPSFLVNKNGTPKRWERKDKGKGIHVGEGYSDHLPIGLTLTTIPDAKPSRKVFLEALFEMRAGKVDVSLHRAIVSYVHKDGFVLSQNARGIYVYKPGLSLKPGQVVDVRVMELKDYHGMKEITALHVTKIHADTVPPSSAMLEASRLQDARGGDVMKEIHGRVEGKVFHTQYGAIRLYAKDPKLMPRFGMNVTLKGVRVGVYHGKNEVILEEKE